MVDGAIIDVAKDLFVSWLPNSINESRPCSGQNFEKPDHMASLKRISHKDDDRLHHHFRDRYGTFTHYSSYDE